MGRRGLSVRALRTALDPAVLARESGLEPDPWQVQVLRSNAPRMLLNCCRQSGKSTTTAVLAVHKAVYHRRSLVLVLSPTLRQSQELFAKCKLVLPIKPESETALSLELVNGSRIISLPGTEKTVRGYSGASLLIVDEAARVDDALYYAIRPMLAVSGGSLIMLSTPHGKRGVFYQEWTEGVSWERHEVPASECPRISPEFLEEERRSMPAWVFRQEYECSFEETEDQLFTHDLVAGAVTPEVEPLSFGEEDTW